MDPRKGDTQILEDESVPTSQPTLPELDIRFGTEGKRKDLV